MLLAAGARDQDVRGFTSRWTSPCSWAASNASATCSSSAIARAGSSAPSSASRCREVRAVDVAHGEEQRAVLFSRVEDRDDVRVVERGGNARLAQEALAEAAVIGKVGGDHLERHLAPEALLLSAVDRAHSSSADEPLDQVAREHAPDHFVGALPD